MCGLEKKGSTMSGSGASSSGEEDPDSHNHRGQSVSSRHHWTLPAAYVSFDVEMDGPNPMQHSLRSIGLALFVESGALIDRLYMNVLPREGHAPHPKTMRDFWERHPEQWRLVNQNALRPEQAMATLAQWLRRHSEFYTLKWVARPACVDWMWLKCYYETFGPAQKPELGYYCHCLATMLRTYFLVYPTRDKKAKMSELSGNLPYNHNAMDDAVCQGAMYMSLRKILEVTKHRFSDTAWDEA